MIVMTEKEFSSPTQVAARLGVSTATILRWIRERKLTATRPGREWRIHEEDLQQFLKEKSNQLPEEPEK